MTDMGSVEKTMSVLRMVADAAGKSITLAEISSLSGINKSTLSHILKKLCTLGYVTRVSHNEGYAAGPELFFLTRYGRYGEEYVGVGHSILKWLSAKTGGTAVFAVVKGTKKYIIDYVEGSLLYKDSGALILADDLYRTVTGKVILANLPLHESIEIFRQIGVPEPRQWNGVYDIDSFENKLSEIRNTEVLISSDTSRGHFFYSFAAPIFRNEKCIGAMGLVLEEENKAPADMPEKTKKLVLKAAREMQRRLEF